MTTQTDYFHATHDQGEPTDTMNPNESPGYPPEETSHPVDKPVYERPSLDLFPAIRDVSIKIGNCLRTSSGLEDLKIAPRAKLMDNWFMEGDLGFLYAPRGIGKTWLALGLATALAGGTRCGPWQAHAPQRVLYIDGEMPCETLAKRITSLGGSMENLQVLSNEALFHLMRTSLNLAFDDMQSVMTNVLLDRKIDVLILDNLSCLFAGLPENDADSWEKVLSWLMYLRHYRIAVVIVHHSGRSKGVMRGTSRREDAAFWVLGLEEAESDGTREGAHFVSRFTKDRNCNFEQTPIEWKFVTNAEGRAEIEWKEASSMAVFRNWIENGLTGAEDIAHEMGVSKGTISKMAQRAIAAGWLRKDRREYALVG